MNNNDKMPEGFVAIISVLVGFFIGCVVGIIFLIKAMACEESDEETTFEYPEPIPFEEMIEHDMDAKFQEWLKEQETSEPEYLIDVTQEDIDLMARVVMSEGSILSNDAKQAIAQTIVNRVRTDYKDFKNQNSVSDVIYFPNAYSTQDNGEPDADCYAAVEMALTYEAFPTDMFWFREDFYHNFGTPYCHIGSTYFSRTGRE